MTTYKILDPVLEAINTKFVSLDTKEVKENNERLKETLWNLIKILKTDPLFDKLFDKPYFGGSYYDDLKVGKPDEFDLDLLFVLPKVCENHNNSKKISCGCVKVIPSNKPGFFWIQVEKGFCTSLDRFIKDTYLQTDLVLNWMKSKIVIALNTLCSSDYRLYNYSVSYLSESGPAITLKLEGNFGYMDVDLVPAFEFGSEYWPKEGFRPNKTNKTDFFLVPKKPKNIFYSERYWRPSFQDQERQLIKGKERLKPSLRLLKKMRNNLNQSKISSYALKTIVLWDLDTSYFNWNESLSEVFMKLLEKYKDSLQNRKIAYYWNEKNNLLDGINGITLENHKNEISRLIKNIKDNYRADPCIIAKVILKEGTSEYNRFINEFKRNSSKGNEMSTGPFNQGISYSTFDPIDNSLTTRRTTPQTVQESSSSWATWGIVATGVGALIGGIVLGALNRNNGNQNR